MSQNYKFEPYLRKILDENREIEIFLKKIEKFGKVFIIGGAIRDSLNSDITNYEIRDLDLVFSDNIKKIEEILESYTYVKNRFGGYKLKFKNLTIDIWSYHDSWAVKNKFVRSKKCTFKSLANGTFLNIDSLIYDYQKRRTYFKHYSEAQISFIKNQKEYIESNPNKDINIIRILYMIKKYKLDITPEVTQYILKNLNSEYLSVLYKAQLTHYKKEVLNKKEIKGFIKELKKNDKNKENYRDVKDTFKT